MGAVLAREANQVVDQLPSYIDKLNAYTRDHFDLTMFSASQRAAAADAGAHLNDFLKDHQDDILGGIASGVSAIFTLFSVGLFTFYLTAQGPQVRRALLLADAARATGAGPVRVGGRRSRRWVGTCTRACCSPRSTAR